MGAVRMVAREATRHDRRNAAKRGRWQREALRRTRFWAQYDKTLWRQFCKVWHDIGVAAGGR